MTKETDLLDSMEYSVQGDTATLKIRLQEQTAEPIQKTSDFGERPWLKEDDQFITYTFGRVNDRET